MIKKYGRGDVINAARTDGEASSEGSTTDDDAGEAPAEQSGSDEGSEPSEDR